jgi:hypothetical protein
MTKKKIILTFLAFLLVLPILNQPFEKLFPTVKATYVEGDITVDTVWTLAESPFIVVQNITVHKGVTLTIEPGVEVRFGGGPFTIIVNGTLMARGTEEKPIKFTSNKENPKVGDWKAIFFNGTSQPPSIMENCIIEYGVYGLTVKNGNLTVSKSILQFNTMSGIFVVGGNLNVTKTVIRSNYYGVVVLGGNAIIQNNSISLNENGVALLGNLSESDVTITKNRIFSNKIGVLLSMNAGGGISIKDNHLFSNVQGLHVSANVTTTITHNYIYENEVGAYYEQGNHTIRFNDIYKNKIGVNASPEAKVNATQNYWGDPTGPYHESLNPRGKGNPVSGNGVNVDFIFFLTASIDYKNSPPKAVLWTDKTKVAPGQEVTFVGSYSEDDGRLDKYLFEFGDGSNSSWTTLSIFFHKYNNVGTYDARLTVMDDFGDLNTSLPLTIQVVNLPSLNVELTLSSREIHGGGIVPVAVRVSNNNGPVENANVALYAIRGGFFYQQTGLTNSSGFFTTTFKAPNVTDPTYIRIIAKASMEGYADGSAFDYLKIVKPENLTVTIAPSSYWVESEKTVKITVHVKCGDRLVENATVTIKAEMGTFPETQALTNSSGCCEFSFTAPKVSETTSIRVTVNAEKYGYQGSSQSISLTVSAPPKGGINWPVILLILVPVVLVAIFAVLVKAGVISVSFSEEGEKGEK